MFSSLRTVRRKTLRDLWGNRGRTLLVALNIAIGVLAVGLIVAAQDFVITDVRQQYANINPADIEIRIPAGAQAEDVDALRNLAGVKAVQGRCILAGRYRVDLAASRRDDNAWRTMEFIAIPDPESQEINKIFPQSGAWPPGRQELLVERAALTLIDAKAGDTIFVDGMGVEREYSIVGTAHRQDDVASVVRGLPIVIVNMDSMEQLQGHRRQNVIYLTVQHPELKASVAETARQRLEDLGYTIGRITLLDPNRHPTQDILNTLLLIMGILAVLTLLLSGFLVTITISSFVSQQIRQIGVMKALGATTSLVARAYSLTVLAFSTLGILIGIPIAERGGYRLAAYLVSQINVDLYPFRRSIPSLIAMIVVGLAIPFVAAANPLMKGARITIRQAIADYGLGGGSGNNRLSQLLSQVRGLPRVLALALRNTVRVPARLVLALLTLSLGGATFIAVLSVDRSFNLTVENYVEGQYGLDAALFLKREQRVSWLLPFLQSVPGVVRAESWYYLQVPMKLADGQQVQVLLQAGPDDTQLYHPILKSGRWLIPEDGNAIVVNRKWAQEEGVKIGDVVQLDLGGAQSDSKWVVVGTNHDLVRQQTGVFVRAASLDEMLRRSGHTSFVQLQFDRHDPAAQRQIVQQVVTALNQQGVEIYETQTLSDMKSTVTGQIRILITFLLAMSVLIGLVGGIGLMGMMSINVLERSKEIGVLRSIGATNLSITLIHWGESIIITLASYLLALPLSIPISRNMTRLVGMAFIQTPLDFAYAYEGLLYWLGIVLLVGTLASTLPTYHAMHMSIRECLSYE